MRSAAHNVPEWRRRLKPGGFGQEWPIASPHVRQGRSVQHTDCRGYQQEQSRTSERRIKPPYHHIESHSSRTTFILETGFADVHSPALEPAHGTPRGIISRRSAIALLVLAVLARGIVPLYWSDRFFHADQAVMGLMAKHLAEGRALPVMQYGQQYVLVIEAWLSAPLMWLNDSSPLLLRLVPFALNIVTAVLLFIVLTAGAAGLSTGFALLATLPVAFPGISASLELTDAIGMNIEPLLFAIVLWILRTRPVACGVVAAIAIKNREFALYAVAALVFVEWLRDRQMPVWRPRVAGLVAFAVTWTAIALLDQYSSPMGPGTSRRWMQPQGDNLAVAANAFCFAPERIPGDVRMVATELLPLQYGVRSLSWRESRIGTVRPPDASWLWIPLVAMLLAGVGRGLWRAWSRGPTTLTWLGIYLVLIGLQAVAVYSVSRCGNASFFTTRYMLLSLFIPTGALILALEREQARWMRVFVLTICITWLGVIAAGHLTALRGFMEFVPTRSYRELATYLDEQGIRYISTDYWTGYHVAYLTAERVRAETNFDRVQEHVLAVGAHRDEIVEVRRLPAAPCEGGVMVASAFYVCPRQ
jgi:hypothetical protein